MQEILKKIDEEIKYTPNCFKDYKDGLIKAKEIIQSEQKEMESFAQDYELLSKDFVMVCEENEQLKKTNGWIPVSERLPDKGGFYLVSTLHGIPRVMVGYYCIERNEWDYCHSTMPILSVIAWQQLPEPYKEESK